MNGEGPRAVSHLFLKRVVSGGYTTVSFIPLCARGLGKRYRNYVASLSYGFYPSDKAPPSVINHSLSGWYPVHTALFLLYRFGRSCLLVLRHSIKKAIV